MEGSPEQTEVPIDPATGDASTEAMQERIEGYSGIQVDDGAQVPEPA